MPGATKSSVKIAVKALLPDAVLAFRDLPQPSIFFSDEPVARYFGPTWSAVLAAVIRDVKVGVVNVATTPTPQTATQHGGEARPQT